MATETIVGIQAAKRAAMEVLLHNMQGPFHGLPRTAGWGYPEPYTRDLMLGILGIAVSGDQKLLQSTRNVLITLAQNQTEHGHIPSLVHDKDDRGASDTTPLFLLGVGVYRQLTGEADFLNEAVEKAFTWLTYQSPSDRNLIAQQPTSDWRDEQWVIGYGLYVNALVYSCLRMFGRYDRAARMLRDMERFTIADPVISHHIQEGLKVRHKPYYAFWSYKLYSSERFDLLGNCLAILSGLAPPTRAEKMVSWIEEECEIMRQNGDLALNLPPNFFPFIREEDPEWLPRYSQFNKPGEYHNGGVWPFIAGFYVAALVAAKRYKLAHEKLLALTECIKISHDGNLNFGFNEWIKAQDGQPLGQDWQSWSAALYLYAAHCVEEKQTPFFDAIRGMQNHPEI